MNVYRLPPIGLTIDHETTPSGESISIIAGVRISHRTTMQDAVEKIAKAAYEKGLKDGQKSVKT